MMTTQPPQETPAKVTVAALHSVSRYYGKVCALQDVSLEIRAGKVMALLGPNGAGKTTAVNLLLGLMRPTRGEATLFGRTPNHPQSRVRVGAMLQISGVPATLKVREHIDLFRSYYPDPLPLAELLDIAGLIGLEERVYGKLSGGQKQRLHLALTLAGNPDLLFLDEPTTGLDVTTRRALWAQVRRVIRQGRTVVLTTHYLEEADALADRIALLDHGVIIAEGTPAEIKARTANRRIRCLTRSAPSWIAELAGVSSVRRDGQATEILATNAEEVVLELLQADPSLRELEVSNARLEDAFLALTRQQGEKV